MAENGIISRTHDTSHAIRSQQASAGRLYLFMGAFDLVMRVVLSYLLGYM